ncbi:hypothetical protein QQ045_013616 [Rhodiola kirilowii]
MGRLTQGKVKVMMVELGPYQAHLPRVTLFGPKALTLNTRPNKTKPNRRVSGKSVVVVILWKRLTLSRSGGVEWSGVELELPFLMARCHILPPMITARPSPFAIHREIFSNRNTSTACSAKKKTNFVDQILDYIEGGPKLRKWYGAAELLPKDGSGSVDLIEEEEDSLDDDEIRDAVLVTDGDSELGQMVILSLIVKRARVKALVKDKRAALEAFGTYVESMTKDASDGASLKKALRGVRSVISPSEGFLSNAGYLKGVKHLILLSQLSVYRSASGIQSLLTNNARKMSEQDESMLTNSRIPYTIVRAGLLKNTPGGIEGFIFEEVANGKESVSNWKELIAAMIDEAA